MPADHASVLPVAAAPDSTTMPAFGVMTASTRHLAEVAAWAGAVAATASRNPADRAVAPRHRFRIVIADAAQKADRADFIRKKSKGP
jgi:hypothetical protein